MCKHVLNAQVSIRAPCCGKWFDCAKCHEEQMDHPLQRSNIMIFGCKKCKHVFRKDMRDFDESDEYCPNCDNHFVIDAETPKSRALNEGKAKVLVGVEGDTAKEAEELREKMMRKMMEEGIDEDLLEDWAVCGKEKSSEAGNRTPVVRVTGGNTKPLYYFGPIEASNEGYMKGERNQVVGVNVSVEDCGRLQFVNLNEAIKAVGD